MADAPVEMKPTLGLTGLTMNAMALIAPGAFLWLTFAGQAAAGADRARNVDWNCVRHSAMSRNRRLLCRNGEAIPWNRQLLLFRGTIVS